MTNTTIDTYELGIVYVKSKSLIMWNTIDEQKIEIYNIYQIAISKHKDGWYLAWYSYDTSQEYAFKSIVKSLKIVYE